MEGRKLEEPFAISQSSLTRDISIDNTTRVSSMDNIRTMTTVVAADRCVYICLETRRYMYIGYFEATRGLCDKSHIHEGPQNNLLIFHMTRLTGGRMIKEGNIRGNTSSLFCYCCQGLLNIFSQNNKGNRVMWNIKLQRFNITPPLIGCLTCFIFRWSTGISSNRNVLNFRFLWGERYL